MRWYAYLMPHPDGPPPPETDIESYLRGDFLGALAHAIRSPVGVVQGAVDELRETRDPADLAWLLPMLERGVHRLLRLAQSLSVVRDIETGRLVASPGACDLATIVQGCVATLDPPWAERVRVELPAKPVAAHCDRSLVTLALDQLLDNALRHGGKRVHVTARPGSEPCIEVWDDGPGLAPEKLQPMSQRFVSSRDRGAESDLALGLSIARDTAFLGGATLKLLPSPGAKGTLCRLEFTDGAGTP